MPVLVCQGMKFVSVVDSFLFIFFLFSGRFIPLLPASFGLFIIIMTLPSSPSVSPISGVQLLSV